MNWVRMDCSAQFEGSVFCGYGSVSVLSIWFVRGVGEPIHVFEGPRKRIMMDRFMIPISSPQEHGL